MPGDVILVVLFGAALHASWNALVKASRDKFLDTVLITTSSAVLAAAALPFLPLPAPASWPYLLASAAIHMAYFNLVAAAYRVGDMSYTYPLMRGTAPLLVALASGPLIGERLGPGAWTGIVLICGGVLASALAYRLPRGSILAPTAFALGNAVVIATYTFVDGMGVRLSGDALAYTMWVFLLTAVPLLAQAFVRHRVALHPYARQRWPVGLLGGACTLASYALALWAMTKAPVAPVAALRETSILFGTALAALLLKERLGWVRHVAAAIVALGAAALRLG